MKQTRKLVLSAFFYGAGNCPAFSYGADSADWQYAFADAYSGDAVRVHLRLAVRTGGRCSDAAPAEHDVRYAADDAYGSGDGSGIGSIWSDDRNLVYEAA